MLHKKVVCGQVGDKLNKSSVADYNEDDTVSRVLPPMDMSSDILDDEDVELLRERLPARLENHRWSLGFSTTRFVPIKECSIIIKKIYQAKVNKSINQYYKIR